MKHFQKLLPVAAVLISLSPLAAKAVTYNGSHPAISHSWDTEFRTLAENSKGRATDHYAVNSKGRATDHYAANSKGRATDHYAVNSKGRPGEFARPTAEQAAFTGQNSFSAATPPNANDAPIPNGN